MDKSALVRLFGYKAAFLHGDPLMYDRWRFVCKHLPVTRNNESVFDVGCGSGAYTIGAAKRGYRAIGLSWDEQNQMKASHRAKLAGAVAEFPIGDARVLDQLQGNHGAFDYVISLENIEHIIDDKKLIKDLAACLKPGGWLILSTPNKDYKAISSYDNGPFSKTEDGWHVRRGYTSAMLKELAMSNGLVVEEIGSCSGFFSQKLTKPLRMNPGWHILAWAIVLPLRFLPLLFDRLIRNLTGFPDFSLTLVAYKPRMQA